MSVNGTSSFTTSDLKMLAKLRVPVDALLEDYLARVTDAEARASYGIRAPSTADNGGLLYKYKSLATGSYVTYRVRRDNPPVDANGKEKDKYISAWGDAKHFYPAPHAIEMLKDPEAIIVLVEAEKSALSLDAWAVRKGRKIAALAMGGCYGAWGRIGKRENSRGVRVDEKGFISDLNYCDRRTVYVMLDSNVKTNLDVNKARGKLVRELRRRGATVFIVNLPLIERINGPDDYIAANDDDAVARLIDGAQPSTIYYDYGGGRFELDDKGIFFIPPPDKEGHKRAPLWLCSSLQILAKTRDSRNSEWGRLLEWEDADQSTHRWAMPMELLQRDGGVEARAELARQGLMISPAKNARESLATYLQVWPIDVRARCVNRLGWVAAGQDITYVLPHTVLGSSREEVVFQNAHAFEPAFSTLGTIESWRDSVARLAQGNSRLVFAISAAFAGALLEISGDTSGGFHICGPSSIGKSTALEVAASVWGEPAQYCRRWRTTVNGLEGLAALHNDGLLILDELSQVDPKDAGEAAYLLANGQGKTRSNRNGMAKASLFWRLLFLSAGEESLSTLMARIGRKPTVGQEIRLAEIEADAGSHMGLLEDLHDCSTPAAMVLTFRDAVKANHGAVGQHYLRLLTRDRTETRAIAAYLNDRIAGFVTSVTPPDAVGGQIERVARRFALVALAGRLATLYGLTGWPEDEAERGTRACFESWLRLFGGGNREEDRLLAKVRKFLELHGSTRFQDLEAGADQRIINRAGFYLSGINGGREYLVFCDIFADEICPEDPRLALRVLSDRGWLKPSKDRPSQERRLPGLGTTRVYVMEVRDE